MSRQKNHFPTPPSISALMTEFRKLSLDQKLRLERKLQAAIATDIAALGCPPGIMSEDDPNLEAELDRRLREAQSHSEQWLTLEQFRRSVTSKLRTRPKLGRTLSRRGNHKS